MGVGIVEDGGIGGAAANVEAAFDVLEVANAIGTADLVVAFGDDDFMVVAADELQDFADGLAEFGVGDAAADVEADENFAV